MTPRTALCLVALAALTLGGCSRARVEKCAQQRSAVPLYRVIKQGKYGYIDRTGKVIIRPQFAGGQAFGEGFVLVECVSSPSCPKQNAYMDCRGDSGFGHFSTARPFSEGFAAVERGGKWGYITDSAQSGIPARFQGNSPDATAREFHEGLAAVPVGDRWGYIDTSGSFVISPQRITVALVETPGPSEFSEGLAAVAKDGKWGYIDRTGAFAISPRFASAERFSDGLALVSVAGKYGYIDKSGAWVVEPRFEQARSFTSGCAAVRTGDTWGYIAPSGEFTITPRFEDALPFSEGLAAVKLAGQYGYIDKTGKTLISPRYDAAGSFTKGLAEVTVGADQIAAKRGYINAKGEWVWKPTR